MTEANARQHIDLLSFDRCVRYLNYSSSSSSSNRLQSTISKFTMISFNALSPLIVGGLFAKWFTSVLKEAFCTGWRFYGFRFWRVESVHDSGISDWTETNGTRNGAQDSWRISKFSHTDSSSKSITIRYICNKYMTWSHVAPLTANLELAKFNVSIRYFLRCSKNVWRFTSSVKIACAAGCPNPAAEACVVEGFNFDNKNLAWDPPCWVTTYRGTGNRSTNNSYVDISASR